MSLEVSARSRQEQAEWDRGRLDAARKAHPDAPVSLPAEREFEIKSSRARLPFSLHAPARVRVHVTLEAPAGLRIALNGARATDDLGVADEVWVSVNGRRVWEWDAVPAGETRPLKSEAYVPAEATRAGANVIELAFAAEPIRIDEPGLTVETCELPARATRALAARRLRVEAARTQWAESLERLEAARRASPFLVAATGPLFKVFQDDLSLIAGQLKTKLAGERIATLEDRTRGELLVRLLDRDRPVQLAAARGEQESFQILVGATAGRLARVRVLPGELAGPAGATLPASAVRVEVVGYVQTKPPRYRTERVGWWPDVLLPAFEPEVEAGALQPFWLTVRVPAEAQAGVYRGTVRVAATWNGREAVERVPVELRVWDLALPASPTCQTALDLSAGWVTRFYDRHPRLNPDGLSHAQLYERFLADFLDYRVWPFTLSLDTIAGADGRETPDLARFDRCVQQCIDRGMRRINIASYANRAHGNYLFEDASQRYLVDVAAHLWRKGWFERAYYYGIDEGAGDIRRTYELAHRIAPGLKTLTTSVYRERLGDAVDIYVPRTCDDWRAYVERGVPAALARQGREYWLYTSGFPYPPVWPQVYVDVPAVDNRIIFWTIAKWRLGGYLKVPITSWYHIEDVTLDYRRVRTQWDVNPGIYGNSNGEILAIYPGPGGRMLGSIRLACIRDGIDDHDLLAMLRILSELGALEGEDAERARGILAMPEIPRPYWFPRRVEGAWIDRTRRTAGDLVSKYWARTPEAERRLAGLLARQHRWPAGTPEAAALSGRWWVGHTEPDVHNVGEAEIVLQIVNLGGAARDAEVTLSPVRGVAVEPSRFTIEAVPPRGSARVTIKVRVTAPDAVAAGLQPCRMTIADAAGTQAAPLTLAVRRVYGAMVIGPIPSFKEIDIVTGRQRVALPEKEFEPGRSYTDSNGRPVRWEPMLIDVADGRVDFVARWRPRTKDPDVLQQFDKRTVNSAAAYVRTCIASARARRLRLSVKASGAARAYWNGKLVYDTVPGVTRDVGPEEAELLARAEKPLNTPATLAVRQGWNVLLLRFDRGGREWRGAFTFTDPETGKRVDPQGYARADTKK